MNIENETEGTTQLEKAAETVTVPSSPAVNSFIGALGGGKNMKDYITAHNKVQSADYYVEGNDGKGGKIITAYKADSLQYKIQLCNFDRYFTGNNKGIMKIFTFLLIQMYKQCFVNGKLAVKDGTVTAVKIKYQDMVKYGLYESEDAARLALNTHYQAICKMAIDGKDYVKTKKAAQDYITLFTAGFKEKGGYSFVPSTIVDWKGIAAFFMLAPRWIFKLSINAFELAFYAFYLARQNAAKIAEQGYFTINMRTIQARLNLPDEKTTKNPKKLIKDPIIKAIDEINAEAAKGTTKSITKLELSDNAKEEEVVKAFLDNGKLLVYVQGELLEKAETANTNRIQAKEHSQEPKRKRKAKVTK